MTEYRIESITIKDIGVFDDIEIVFPKIESVAADEKKAEIHLFTGANGCGKSTLLYALAGMFIWHFDGLISKRFKREEAAVNYKFSNLINQVSGSYQARGSREDYLYEMESPSFYAQKTSTKTNKAQEVFDYAAFAYSGRRTLKISNVHNIEKIQKSPFDGALSFEGDTDSNLMAQWILNSLSSAALAEVEGDKQAAQNYQFAVKRIEDFINEICQLNIKFKIERSPLAVKLQVNGDILDFDVLPDGLKSIISWVADLAMRLDSIPWAEQRDIFSQNIILFLDEIDIHLHPKWQRRILPAVQKLLPNAQIFASTHSPFVVGSVEDAWVYKLPEKGEQKDRLIKPIKSSSAKSYALILDEVFGIDKDFGVEVESLLSDFYQYRNAFLQDKSERDNLIKIAKELLSKNSEEINAIISREMRQIKRLTNEDLVLA